MFHRLLKHVECPTDSTFTKPTKILKEITEFNPCNIDNLSLISINIRSIRKNFNLLLLFLKSIKIPISIISICETWLYDGEEQLFNISGYNQYFVNRSNNSRSGGLIVYVANHLHSFPMDNLSMIHQFFDSLFIKVFIGNKAHIFGSVYRSTSNSLTSFIQSFKVVILDNLPMNLSTICGGFNLNLLNAPSHSGATGGSFRQNLISPLGSVDYFFNNMDP